MLYLPLRADQLPAKSLAEVVEVFGVAAVVEVPADLPVLLALPEAAAPPEPLNTTVTGPLIGELPPELPISTPIPRATSTTITASMAITRDGTLAAG
jgi:hypothetical protein